MVTGKNVLLEVKKQGYNKNWVNLSLIDVLKLNFFAWMFIDKVINLNLTSMLNFDITNEECEFLQKKIESSAKE